MYKAKILIFIMFLIVGITTSPNSKNVTAKSNLTGVEIYTGIVFGQGSLGKKVITNQTEYKKMNSRKSVEFVKQYVQFIKLKNPNYFNKLKKSFDTKNATESLKLLQSSGVYFDAFTKTNTNESNLLCGVVAVCGAAVVAAVYNYVVFVQAGVVLQVGYAAWALKTKAVKNSTSNINPEAELAKILKSI